MIVLTMTAGYTNRNVFGGPDHSLNIDEAEQVEETAVIDHAYEIEMAGTITNNFLSAIDSGAYSGNPRFRLEARRIFH